MSRKHKNYRTISLTFAVRRTFTSALFLPLFKPAKLHPHKRSFQNGHKTDCAQAIIVSTAHKSYQEFRVLDLQNAYDTVCWYKLLDIMDSSLPRDNAEMSLCALIPTLCRTKRQCRDSPLFPKTGVMQDSAPSPALFGELIALFFTFSHWPVLQPASFLKSRQALHCLVQPRETCSCTVATVTAQIKTYVNRSYELWKTMRNHQQMIEWPYSTYFPNIEDKGHFI